MMRATVTALAAALFLSGCSGLVPAAGPEPDELAEIRSRILELQRATAMTRVEIDRLRQQVVALQSQLGGGVAPPATATREPQSAGMMPPASEPVEPERSEVEETDLVVEAPTAPQAVTPPLTEPPAAVPPPTVPAPAAPAPSAAPPAAATAAPVSDAAQALYDRGYTLYHQGRYVDAEAGFRRFLQAYPDTSLSDNAQYWIGESRYARNDFEGALAAFREVAQSYPGGNKVADSLLKAADCLQKLGDAGSARTTYDEVIRRFPGSAAAAMAEERRGQL